MLILIALILGFISLSGALAMIDAAVLSVTQAEIEEMIIQKKSGARALKTIKEHVTRAVVIIVLLTNTVNVLGPIVVGYWAVELYGSAIIGIITAVLTFGTIVFSEIIPKSIGSHYAPTVSRFVAPWIQLLIRLLYPLVWLLENITQTFRKGAERPVGTEEQITSLVKIGRNAGHIEYDESQLISRAFRLNDCLAEKIMAPKEKMIQLSRTDTVREAADVVFSHPYSRYPVFEHDGTTCGIALSRDILLALAKGKDQQNISEIMHDPILVPYDMKADDLIALFRNRRMHMAIVKRDDDVIGIVTLEDVLEELVGEIEDETDTEVRAEN